MSNIIDSIQLSGTIYTLSAQTSGGGVPESTFSAYTAATDSRLSEDEEVTAAGLNALNDKIDSISGANAIEVTQAEYDALVTGGTVDPNAFYIITDATEVDISQYWTSAQTQSAITEATSGKVDTSTYSTYTAATDTALASKQTTLTAGTGISIVDNVISATGGGGGGKAIEAGRGIAITTGETADTVSFNLPISAGTGTNSIAEGDASNKASGSSSHAEGSNTKANGSYSHAEGFYSTAKGSYSHAEGFGANANGASSHAEGGATNANGAYSHAEGDTTTAKGNYSHTEGLNTIANNQSEHASGRFNNSVSASTTFGDSGNTLFSVGNGTADNARHNAFEIRQNGDIYLSSGGTDIKLQDHLGGGVSESTFSAYTAATDSRISEDEEVTAAALNTLNDALGGMKLVKLTQTEYDNLSTKDSNTLYVIVN